MNIFKLLTNEKVTDLCVEIDHEVYKIGFESFINEKSSTNNFSNNEKLENLFEKLEKELKEISIFINNKNEIYKKIVTPIMERYSKQSKNNHYH